MGIITAHVEVLFKFCCLLCPFESETLILDSLRFSVCAKLSSFYDQNTPNLHFKDILGEYSPAHFKHTAH